MRLLRRRTLCAGLAAVAVAQPAWAMPNHYVLDQSLATLDFTAHHLGMFTSSGRFTRFAATVDLDPADPTRAQVDVTVRTGSVTLDFPGAVDMLRSPDFFDVAASPTARFHGTAVGVGTAAAFPIDGALTVRGITHPFAMTARLLSRAMDPARGADVATFSAGGTLSRSDYGMTAERLMIGDAVQIGVTVRLLLSTPSAHG